MSEAVPRKPKDHVTSTGKEIPPAPHRVAFAQEKLYGSSYSVVRQLIMDTFGVSKATAERDIAHAQVLIAEDAERERPLLRARETMRLNRIADKAEDAAEYQAAVAASRGIGKINGLEVQIISHSTTSPEAQAHVNALVLTPYQRRKRIEELRSGLADRPAVDAPASPDDADE